MCVVIWSGVAAAHEGIKVGDHAVHEGFADGGIDDDVVDVEADLYDVVSDNGLGDVYPVL